MICLRVMVSSAATPGDPWRVLVSCLTFFGFSGDRCTFGFLWLYLASFGFFWGCLRNQLRLLLVFGEGGHRFSGELVWENCATEWGV